jgi:hypothetical protein
MAGSVLIAKIAARRRAAKRNFPAAVRPQMDGSRLLAAEGTPATQREDRASPGSREIELVRKRTDK